MDWLTIVVAVGSSLIGGGLIGGLVALRIASKESKDRKEVLSLEREKWEHEKAAKIREDARKAAESAIEELDTMMHWAVEMGRAQSTWKYRIADPEVREQTKAAFAEVARITGIMPGLMSSIYSLPPDLVPPSEQIEAGKSLVEAYNASSNYILSCTENQHDSDLYNQFIRLHGTASMNFKAILGRIG